MRITGAALRHRRGQALALALLSVLITATVAFTPLFVRGVENALVLETVRAHPISSTGLTISAAVGYNSPPATPRELEHELLTPTGRSAFGTAQYSWSAEARPPVKSGPAVVGQLTAYAGQCAHLRILTGRCPTNAGEIAVSAADARNFGYRVGGTVRAKGSQVDGPQVELTVSGIYAQRPGYYWLGARLTGQSGHLYKEDTGLFESHDVWITARSSFEGTAAGLPGYAASVALPIRPGVGIDGFLALGPALRTMDNRILDHTDLGNVSTQTDLRDLVHSVAVQRSQARVTVPLVMAQMVALVLFVLWLVLVTAIDQRRPEVAASLLRGYGRRGARRLLLEELLPPMLVGVPVGMALAVTAYDVVKRVVLAPVPPTDLTSSFWLAGIAVLALLSALALTGVFLATRVPVEKLLRRVGERGRHTLTPATAMLLAASGALFAAFALGALQGSVALVGPALLALLVGVLVSLVVTPVAALIGRRLLRRGRIAGGLSILDAARSPATRRTVALTTVASALLVFTADAFVVASRNRASAAVQAVGAPRVITVGDATGGSPASQLQRFLVALHEADPSGRRATPVVEVQPPSPIAPTTMLVDPRGFGAVVDTLLGTPLPLHHLVSPSFPALVIHGTQVRIQGGEKVTSDALGPQLALLVGYPDSPPAVVPVAAAGGIDKLDIRTQLACGQGCYLMGIGLTAQYSGASTSGSVDLAPLQVDGKTVPWGATKDWAGGVSGGGQLTATVTGSGDLHLDLHQSGASDATLMLSHSAFPAIVPAVGTGDLFQPGQTGPSNQVSTAGIDGISRQYLLVQHVPRIPGAPRLTVLADLATQSRYTAPESTAQLTAWLADDGPALRSRVVQALGRHGLRDEGEASIAAQRLSSARTASAWSLQLGLGAGVAGLLVAVIALVVIGISQWRLRSYDLAALRMAGVPPGRVRTVATASQAIAVVIGLVAGALSGLYGAALALPDIPLFVTRPDVSTLDLSVSWSAVLLAVLAGVVVLGVTAWRVGRSIADRAELSRLRESL